MKITINDEIFKSWPTLRVGVVALTNIKNDASNKAVDKMLAEAEHTVMNNYAETEVGALPEVAAWRSAYKTFNSKPQDFRSSIEALIRRTRNGKPLPRINTLVDLYNYFSLRYLLPIGAEDVDKIDGDVLLSFADGAETGICLGSTESETCYPGEVVYKDRQGFLCRRWNWREADRTKIESHTTNAVVVLEELLPDKDLATAMGDFEKMTKEFLGGESQSALLNKEQTSWSW